MSPVVISPHAREQMDLRGATEAEVEAAISQGEAVPAKHGRTGFRKNFTFRALWRGRYYETKQVVPIVIEAGDGRVVVTVYVYYFGGEHEDPV